MRMKKIALAMSLLVVAAVAFSVVHASVVTADDKAVNKQCPIAKKDIKSDAPTSTVKVGDKEYTVGFCCKNCKGKWDAEKDPLKKWPVKEISGK
jgi:hypothetical protein